MIGRISKDGAHPAGIGSRWLVPPGPWSGWRALLKPLEMQSAIPFAGAGAFARQNDRPTIGSTKALEPF